MTWPAYLKLKPSGVEWLGNVPVHWDVLRADAKLVESRETITPDQLAGKDVFHYSIPSVQETGTGTIEEGDWIDSSKCRILEPVILVSKLNPRKGTIALAEPHPERLTVSSSEFIPLVPVRCHAAYARYAYSSEPVRQHLDSRVESATRSHQRVNPDTIRKLRWAWPPTDEQRTIAVFLDREATRIDALIEKKQRQIELLHEKRAALISHAVTKGLDPNVKMKDSGVEWLGEIPEHWDVRLLKRVAQISYGIGGELDRTIPEGVPILSLPNIRIDGTLDISELAYTLISPDEKKKYLLNRGDLLFNWRNGSSDHVGKTAYFDLEGEFTHVSFLLKLQFDPTAHHSKYFYRLLNGLRTTGFFSSTKAGVNNTFNLSELQNMWVMVPPFKEQKKIAEYLESETLNIDRLVTTIEQSVGKLQEYRTAIISAAVTGKIDVRNEGA
jgi:type I restriction enzyme S subunit